MNLAFIVQCACILVSAFVSVMLLILTLCFLWLVPDYLKRIAVSLEDREGIK